MADDLIAIVPLDRRGRAGMTSIIARSNFDRWVVEHAERLLAAGYMRLEVVDYKPTRAFGDKRRGR